MQPGDTLAGIASRSGIGTGQLAWMNGLDPAGVLLAGTVLKLPTTAPPAQQQEQQPPAQEPQVVPPGAGGSCSRAGTPAATATRS